MACLNWIASQSTALLLQWSLENSLLPLIFCSLMHLAGRSPSKPKQFLDLELTINKRRGSGGVDFNADRAAVNSNQISWSLHSEPAIWLRTSESWCQTRHQAARKRRRSGEMNVKSNNGCRGHSRFWCTPAPSVRTLRGNQSYWIASKSPLSERRHTALLMSPRIHISRISRPLLCKCRGNKSRRWVMWFFFFFKEKRKRLFSEDPQVKRDNLRDDFWQKRNSFNISLMLFFFLLQTIQYPAWGMGGSGVLGFWNWRSQVSGY